MVLPDNAENEEIVEHRTNDETECVASYEVRLKK
jgi:hypothetical protein